VTEIIFLRPVVFKPTKVNLADESFCFSCIVCDCFVSFGDMHVATVYGVHAATFNEYSVYLNLTRHVCAKRRDILEPVILNY
jgi:hypothetical protein